jgi:8-oxo-dGTP diphosphatase
MLTFHAQPDAIIDAFQLYSPPLPKWQTVSKTPQSVIPIAAALVHDDAGRVLLVRKRGTRAFTQPGGKLRDFESHLAALERELREELGCTVRPGSPAFLGTFRAPAANETGCMVTAALYRVEVDGPVRAAAEIEEIAWIHPEPPHQIELAPLTRESVLPLAVRWRVGAHKNGPQP